MSTLTEQVLKVREMVHNSILPNCPGQHHGDGKHFPQCDNIVEKVLDLLRHSTASTIAALGGDPYSDR